MCKLFYDLALHCLIELSEMMEMLTVMANMTAISQYTNCTPEMWLV